MSDQTSDSDVLPLEWRNIILDTATGAWNEWALPSQLLFYLGQFSEDGYLELFGNQERIRETYRKFGVIRKLAYDSIVYRQTLLFFSKN